MRRWRPAAAALVALAGGTADAHPVHEVVQNAYLTIAPGAVSLQLDLTAGPQVAGRIIDALDANRDRRVDRREADAYALRVLAAQRLAIDGHAAMLRAGSVAIPSYAALLGAHGTIVIVARAQRRDRVGAATLTYRNGYSPAESRCDANVFVQPAGTRYTITGQERGRDGRDLRVRYVTSAPR